MKHKRNWIAALVLTAAAGFFSLRNVSAPAPDAAQQPSAYEGCGYQWAYHDEPNLTEKFSALVKEFSPQAEARVTLFGEDCIYADGRADFSAMETDFFMRLKVDDLTDEDALGNEMSGALEAVLKLPREEIQGNYGFVEFWFEQGGAGQVIVRVPIQRYIDEARGKSGAELFRMFSVPIPL